MTNKTRRTEITIETHEVTIIRRRELSDIRYCDRCQTQAVVYEAGEIAAILGETTDKVEALTMSGRLHAVDSVDKDATSICSNSAQAVVNPEKFLALKHEENIREPGCSTK